MELIFLIYLFVGIIFMAISIPLIKRKVKINNWYGIRLPETMKNEKLWYEVNEKSGKHLFVFGLAICLLTLVLYFSKFFSYNVSFLIMTFLILVGTITFAILAFSVTNRLSKMK